MSDRWPWIACAIVVAVIAWLTVLAVADANGEDRTCARRGGHMVTTSWIQAGKVLVPIDTCVGGR